MKLCLMYIELPGNSIKSNVLRLLNIFYTYTHTGATDWPAAAADVRRMCSSKTDQMSINVKVLFHVLARDFKPVAAAELTSSSTQGGENKKFSSILHMQC
jgi:hypothetical protein